MKEKIIKHTELLEEAFLDPTPHPTPNNLHSTPFTLHPTPYTPNPTPYTLYPAPYALHPTPYTLHPTPYTLNDHQVVNPNPRLLFRE